MTYKWVLTTLTFIFAVIITAIQPIVAIPMIFVLILSIIVDIKIYNELKKKDKHDGIY